MNPSDDSPPQRKLERWQTEAEEVPPCGPDDLTVSVRWTSTANGGLRGEVVAENVGSRTCRLGNKPGLRPIGTNGQPLDVRQFVTLELRIPPFVVLRPGQRASAPIRWSGWNGRPASGQVIVSWQGGSATVNAEGPTQPGPAEHGPGDLTSSWFTLETQR